MKLLLIEDDERVARLINLELKRAGWSVDWSVTGREGLARAIGDTYGVVILDLTLPDLDGMSVCQSLRQVSTVPILMLTARDSVGDRVKGLDAGADDYLTKPFATSELLARIRALTRRQPSLTMPQDTLSVGPLELSVSRHQVSVNQTPMELTRREFDLLHYLMQNPDITLTRDMILDQVWGWGYVGASNIVDVYVGYLRQKLEAVGGPPLITTIRGVGYALRWDEKDS
ncbi:MAG: response regulator transcription factor [Firmicutes bacterium]|jgi:DNA-binding response OmpR family regulator|nr:response regulator transcription factor [Bacillota bacterium]MCL5972675.1 response regulator transcription factor [Bacillota bacterium]